MIMLPTMSAGIRSGVNWMREYFSCRARAMVRSSVVLPSPGTPSEQHMAGGDQADQHAFHHILLTDNHFGDFVTELR